MTMRRPMALRRHAWDPRGRWLPGSTLVLLLAASCSSALDNQPNSTPDAGPEKSDKPGGEPSLPTPELTEKYEAAKAAPQDFEVVSAYAKAIADFCRGTLVDDSCGDACKNRPVKYKPSSELDPKYWVLTQNALAKLDAFKDIHDMPPAKFEQFVEVKGRLLGLAGLAAEEKTLIDGYALAHPDAISVIRRRLEILREAGDVKESESQCSHSRSKIKSAAAALRTEFLTMCVALHPDNKDSQSEILDYAKYLPGLSRAEQRLYFKYIVQHCIEKVGSKQTRCAEACACKGMPDKQAKAKCKAACINCRITTTQRIRNCKKTGTADPPPSARPRRRGRRKGAAPAPADTGPAPQTTVL